MFHLQNFLGGRKIDVFLSAYPNQRDDEFLVERFFFLSDRHQGLTMAKKGSNGYRWLHWGWGWLLMEGLFCITLQCFFPWGFPRVCEVGPVLQLSLGWGYCLPHPSSHLQGFTMPVGNRKGIIRKYRMKW